MSAPEPDPVGLALVELGRIAPWRLIDGFGPGSTLSSAFAAAFPDRYFDVTGSDPATTATAVERSRGGDPVVALGAARRIAGGGYEDLRGAAHRTMRARFVANPRTGGPGVPPMVEDIGIVRGIPKMTVICPADRAAAASALRATADHPGPVYLRLPPVGPSMVSEGSFELGRARELRAGSDLALLAIGAAVPKALDAAAALERIGIHARVLDLASVKPIDEKAILRAARETGAILTLEEHSALTGMGSAVAAVVAEERPVPVRRLGAPDLFPSGEPRVGEDPYGLSAEHIEEAAYDLLRARGKVQ